MQRASIRHAVRNRENNNCHRTTILLKSVGQNKQKLFAKKIFYTKGRRAKQF